MATDFTRERMQGTIDDLARHTASSPVWSTRIPTAQSAGDVIKDTNITQAAHGFSVGTVVYRVGGSWTKSKADAVATAAYIGVVSAITDVNTFDIVYAGVITGLSGLTDGSVYYISDAVAGATIVRSALTANGFPVPVMVATSATAAVVLCSSQIAGDLQGLRMDFGSSNTLSLLASDFVGTGRALKIMEIDVCSAGAAKKMLIIGCAPY